MSNEQKQRKAVFKVVDGPEFPTTRQVAEMTTTEIAKHINATFRRIFSDYHGCTIQCDITQYPQGENIILPLDVNHPVQVTLYFSPTAAKSADGKFVAFRPVGSTDSKSIGESITGTILNHNQMMRQNRASTATQDAIDIFHDLLWPEVYARTSENPNMKELSALGIFAEMTLNNKPNHGFLQAGGTVYATVNYLDIDKIWKCVWKDEEGVGDYRTRPIKPALSAADYTRRLAMEQQNAVPIEIAGAPHRLYMLKTEMPFIVEVSKLRSDVITDLYQSMNGSGFNGIFTDSY